MSVTTTASAEIARLTAIARRAPMLGVGEFAAEARISEGDAGLAFGKGWVRLSNPYGGSYISYVVADNWMQDQMGAWFGAHPEIVAGICDGGPGSEQRAAAEAVMREAAAGLEAVRSSQPPDPVGLVEIAERLQVERATADAWKQRGLLPAPEWTVGGRPAWPWYAIEAWARETGRLPAGRVSTEECGVSP